MAQTGFTPADAERQREAEAAVLEAIAPAGLEAMSRTLSRRMHVAGGPAQAAVRDTLAAWFQGWGFEPEIATYEVFLPWPTDASLALTAPDTMAFHLSEEVLAADAAAALPHYPWVNGYSASGEVEAEVLYVNHGLHEDYARLDSMRIGVEGRVALARYGRSFRGIKARLAAEHGAAALLLYSDPADDGYVQGDVYPEGPFRPWSGVQRGSVMNGTGDPTTPDGPSTAGAPRVPLQSLVGLPAIPVMPISYAVAGEILSRLGNADLPDQGWQGGLPFRYHAGPGPVRVRLRVDDDRDGPAGGMKSIYDVTARIEGSQWSDEWIVVGAHIDAWGPGANDNVSGTASVLAAANAIRALADGGHPPRRTIVFAGWDGEEWGLIGSTEWVEEHAAVLSRGGVAYINQDGVGGQSFAAAASPSLKPFLREASRAIRAENGQSLHDVWQGEADSMPRLGDLGGGSDFAPFYNHLGIPSTGHGFGTPGGVYHSAYDTYRHMAEFGDPGFVHHAQTAELTAIMASRLANAEILPYDFAALAREMAALWKPLREAALADSLLEEDHDPLGHALAALEEAGSGFAAVRDGYLAGPADPERSRRANESLRAVERALTREAGLVGRPWVRSLTFAADDRNGYATLGLPGIAEAIRSGSAERVRAEVDDMADRVGRATGSVAEAEAVLAP